MLINFTNHPKLTWSDSQINLAQKNYGDIIDLPFPKIDPNSSTEMIYELAENYFDKINKMSPVTVHLMGELSFCYMLAKMLEKNAIPCIVSTTKRVAYVDGEVKTAVFQFVSFRSYF